mgnify:FL=1
MRRFVYPAFAEGDDAEGYSLFFPDLACITAADDLVQLTAMAREALRLHLSGLLEDGSPVPPPSDLRALLSDPDHQGLLPMLVEADLAGAPQAIVVSLPETTLSRVDQAARSRGLTRDQVLEESVHGYLLAG